MRGSEAMKPRKRAKEFLFLDALLRPFICDDDTKRVEIGRLSEEIISGRSNAMGKQCRNAD